MTPQEKNQFRSLITSPQWKLIERMATLVIEKINDSSSLRDTADATLIEVAIKEGKVQGIKQLLQEIMQQAQND